MLIVFLINHKDYELVSLFILPPQNRNFLREECSIWSLRKNNGSI
jgi:hypothetical protein